MTCELSANKMHAEHKPFSNWFIFSYLIGILVLSFFLFPSRLLQDEVLHTTVSHPITIYYLKQFVKKFPDDMQYRIALINQLIGQHEWQNAINEINLLAQKPDFKTEASILTFRLHYTQFFQLKSRKEKAKLFEQLTKELTAISQSTLTDAQLLEFGKMAVQMNLPAQGLALYQRALLQNPNQPLSVYRDVSSIALQVGQYQLAAQYRLVAMNRETSLTLKREDAVYALKALQAGSFFKEGIDVIQHLPKQVTNNKAILQFMTEFALAANRVDLAQIYVKKALFFQEETS